MKKYFIKIPVSLTCLIILLQVSPISAQNIQISNKSNQLYNDIQNDPWFAIDKIQHFSYSCLIALGFQYVLVNKLNLKNKSAMPVSLGLSFIAGVTKEIQDEKSKNGFFSKRDLLANGMGLLLARIIILIPVH